MYSTKFYSFVGLFAGKQTVKFLDIPLLPQKRYSLIFHDYLMM